VLTTNASGVLFGRVLSSAATSTTEWASYAARWTEARVLELRLSFLPFGASVAANPNDAAAAVVAADRSGALAVPTTFGQVWALADPTLFTDQMVKPTRYSVRAIDLEDQDFQPVTSLAATFAAQYAASSASASSTILFLSTDFLVEFKGTQ
jgi:hypothetical protein